MGSNGVRTAAFLALAALIAFAGAGILGSGL